MTDLHNTADRLGVFQTVPAGQRGRRMAADILEVFWIIAADYGVLFTTATGMEAPCRWCSPKTPSYRPRTHIFSCLFVSSTTQGLLGTILFFLSFIEFQVSKCYQILPIHYVLKQRYNNLSLF